MRTVTLQVLFAVVALPPTTLDAQERVRVLGSRVELRLHYGPHVSGELLAANADTVWVLSESELVPVPLLAVRQVRIPFRGGVGRSAMVVWGAVVGIGTGLALSAACSTITDGCGSVITRTIITWSAITGISVALAGRGSAARLGPLAFGQLPAYARFPQGLPAAYPLPDRQVAGEVRQE